MRDRVRDYLREMQTPLMVAGRWLVSNHVARCSLFVDIVDTPSVTSATSL